MVGRVFFNMLDELKKDLDAAIDKIAENRLLAWSSGAEAIFNDKINLKPLTAKAWVDLKLVGNAFIIGGKPSDQDVLEYIWRNHPNYTSEKTAESEKIKRKIGYIFSKTDAKELLDAVYDHINDAFAEMPVGINTKSGFLRNNTIQPIEGMIGAIDEVAARYGQNPIDVLTYPLNRIFQLQKAIRIATIPDYKLAEPTLIRTIKQEILTEINNGAESRT